MTDSTVVAIATAPGEGAIGIVRLGGPGAGMIASRIFRTSGRSPLEPWRLTLGRIRDPDRSEDIDQVLAVFMPGPRSYTGEDMVEFHAHGGRATLEGIVRASLAAGARAAAPGEFTRRAFLRGKIDLAQAEAVIDLIRARTEVARAEALRQLDGTLSRRIGQLKDEMTRVAARIEANLDFGDEEELDQDISLEEPISLVADAVEKLLGGLGEGRSVREGLQVTFVGRPNVGKSSIINMLLDDSRSIVTPYPGTTRDTVESRLLVEGTLLLLVDTAGISPSADPAEKEGVRRSREKFRAADLPVVVVDASEPLCGVDRELLKEAAGRSSLVVMNKTDLPSAVDGHEIAGLSGGGSLVRTSALTGAGIDDLHHALVKAARSGFEERGLEDPLLTNVRHGEALGRTLAALRRSLEQLGDGSSLDLIAEEIREALASLGEITGQTVTEEILDRIFSQFCIGK